MSQKNKNKLITKFHKEQKTRIWQIAQKLFVAGSTVVLRYEDNKLTADEVKALRKICMEWIDLSYRLIEEERNIEMA